MATRDEMVDVARRALRHARGVTTDLAEGTLEIPTSDYQDDSLWRLENERLFRSVPLAVALTAELRESGDYKASEIAGLPVLLVRGGDGRVRAFLNVCRHRAGSCVRGSGSRRRSAGGPPDQAPLPPSGRCAPGDAAPASSSSRSDRTR